MPKGHTSAFLLIKIEVIMLKTANIFVTGGCGTFGRALARHRKKEGWTGRFTIYSTDTMKHERMRGEFPDITFVQGDIRSNMLYSAMLGHDVVIHAAAVKVIPVSEFETIDTLDVNVNGSLNVCSCAVQAKVRHVVGLSTDKACHAANAYGASKYLMEKIFQEYSRMGFETQFHLTRFGNVLESNGSVIEAWKRSVANNEPIKITDKNMTRFWLSPQQAVGYVIDALHFDSGHIYIPRMPALSIGKLCDYVVGEKPSVQVPIRPGEKIHETLLTEEERFYADCFVMEHGKRADYSFFILSPTTSPKKKESILKPYTSDDPLRELSKEELMEILNG